MNKEESATSSNVLTYKWLVGILVLLVLSMGAAWAVEINARIVRVENSVSEIRSEFRSFMSGQTAEHKNITERLVEIAAAVKEIKR